MELYRGSQRVGRVKVKRVGDGTFEGVIYKSLSPGEYTVKVRTVKRLKKGKKEEASTTVRLAVISPYKPMVKTPSSLTQQAANIASVARPLPFLGTAQPTIIDASGTDGYLITIEKGDLGGDGTPDIVAGGDTLFAYDIKNASYLWAIDESGGQLASEIDDIAIADITGDGVPDVVTIDYYDPDGLAGVGSDGLTLWDGSDGSLLWSVDMTSYNSLELYRVEVLAIADLDGDGDLDIAAGGYLGTVGGTPYNVDAIVAFEGGTGTLLWYFDTPADPYLWGVSGPQRVKVGDIDGDGNPEVAAGDENYQVYCLNGEDGSERFTVQVPDQDYVYSMELGDFDADGDLDIAAGSYYAVYAYDENGGQLWQFDEYATYSYYWLDMEAADFNGDGVTDIAAVNEEYAWAIIDGATGFSMSNGGPYGYGLNVAVGDLNGDGTPEMVWGDDSYGTAAVDVTTGNWLWWHNNYYDYVGDLEIGDFNGDGVNEVVGIPAWQDFIYVLSPKAPSNVWGRGFEPIGYDWYNAYSEIYDVASGDLNGDGTPDVVVVDNGSYGNRQVTAMDGATGSPLWSRFCPDWPWILASGDFDGDGSPEVATFGSSTLYLLDGDGSELDQIGSNSSDYFIVVDIDGDGADELVLGAAWGGVQAFDYSGGSLSSLWTTGGINFRNGLSDYQYEEGFAYGDYDGDGTDELLALGHDGSQYTVYEIDVASGATSFVVQGATAWSSIALGQLDGDAQREILLGHSNGVDAYDWVGTIYQWNYAGNDAEHYLLAGDVDGDGYDEAVFAGYENVGVLEEGGTEKWTRDLAGTAANYENDASWDIEDMILADLDADGDLDVAVGAYEMVNLRMLNGLTGVDMTAPVIIDGYGYSTQQLAAGDFVSGGVVEIAAMGFQSVGVFADDPAPPALLGGGSGGGSGCFIATASFGTPMAEEVVVLKKFRDEYLMSNRAGRAFLRLYSRYGPTLADYLRIHEGARAAVRLGLKPLVWLAKFLTR
jgi:hypothetical protein